MGRSWRDILILHAAIGAVAVVAAVAVKRCPSITPTKAKELFNGDRTAARGPTRPPESQVFRACLSISACTS